MRKVGRSSVAVVLTLAALTVSGHSASATGGTIVFDAGGHIWSMGGDGSGKTDLMVGWSGGSAFNPSLSPDGSTIAFEWQTAGPSTKEIYTIPATGTAQGNAVRLTTNTVLDQDPAWSPDGTKLAFTRDTPSNGVPQNYEVYTMSAAGNAVTRLTNESVGTADTDPTWSPDGTKIAYRSAGDGFGCYDEGNGYFIGFSQIHVVPSTGGSNTNILNRSWLSAASPDWSPDGSTIAFYGEEYTLGPDTGNGPTCADVKPPWIFTMSPTGNAANLLSVWPGIWPAWSPDGTQLAFSDYTTQAISAVTTGGVHSVTPLNATGRFVDWILPSAAKLPTTTTVAVTNGASALKATGAVSPNVAGQVVKVVLFRKANGVFSKVAAKSPVLDANSAYVAKFAHPATGTCKVKTTYPGDATHLASSKSVTIAC